MIEYRAQASMIQQTLSELKYLVVGDVLE